jgi:hypothetical protein
MHERYARMGSATEGYSPTYIRGSRSALNSAIHYGGSAHIGYHNNYDSVDLSVC